MLWPILDQNSASPSRSTTSVTKWKNLARSLQDSKWDWFAISIQGWHICQPLFNNNQQFDESKIVDSLANKAPRSHKAMLILQGFNPEMGYLATFVEHCERAKTTDNIAMANFSASEKDSDTKKNKCVPIISRSVKTKVRNIVIPPHFIVASTKKTMFTPQGIAKS